MSSWIVILSIKKNKNWLQFLFFAKAAALKQQISKFYPQIHRTEASHAITYTYIKILSANSSH